jgi:type II secretory pathway pseudopilin PulG
VRNAFLTIGSSRTLRRGITLLELLIVMMIMLMITAAAIPIVVPAMKNRQMREASRMVSTYFSAARTRAIETGRPAGIMIERFNGLPYSLVLTQIESPPPYSGDTTGARATVELAGPTDPNSPTRVTNPVTVTTWLKVTMGTTDFDPTLVRVGDRIQIGGQGPLYTILGPDTNTDGMVDANILDVTLLSDTTYSASYSATVRLPWANTSLPHPMPYQIFRQPTRSTTPPMQLPEGVVIDLMNSGVGISGRFSTPGKDPLFWGSDTAPQVPVSWNPAILFAPTGRLQSVQMATGWQRADQSVYFLLGRRDKMADVANATDWDIDKNLSEISTTGGPMPPAENFWIVAGVQNGQVSVSEVAANTQTVPFSTTTPTLREARSIAQQSQSVGGR